MSRTQQRGALLASVALMAGAPLACGETASTENAGATASKIDHVDGGASASNDCASCHMADFRGAHGHVGQRPTACAVCHASDAWHPTGLRHDFWPLTGKHEKAKCFACHTGDAPVFRGKDKACVACHRPEYDKAPDHTGRFPTTCEECHSTAAWKPLLPDHAAPPGAPSASAAPEGGAPTSAAPARRPAPTSTPTAPRPAHPPQPTPKPVPSSPRPVPTVEPTSNASRRG